MKCTALLALLLPLIVNASSLQDAKALQVNGETVMQSEYFRRMEYLPGLGKNVGSEFFQLLPAIATLDALVTEKLIMQLCKTKGQLPTEIEIDSEIGYRMKEEPKSLENWKFTGRTDAEFRNMVKVDMCQFRLLTEGVSVSDADVAALYDAAKEVRFTKPKGYRIRLITLKDQKNADKVDAELKAGKSFAALAALYSLDETSRRNGGDYGEISETLLSVRLREVLGKMTKGQMSGWIKGEGDTITKVLMDDIIPLRVTPLDASLNANLKRELLVRKGQQKNDVAKLVKEARTKATISISNPSFDKAYREFIGLSKESKPGGK